MFKLVTAAFAIFGHLTLVSGQTELLCYVCANNDSCVDHTNSELYDCYLEVGDNLFEADVSCFSAFLNYSGVFDFLGNPRDSETGVYRGCAILQPIFGDYCSWYRAQLELINITIPSCATCNTTRCNRHTFDPESGLITGLADGSYTPTLSFVMYMITIVLICISE